VLLGGILRYRSLFTGPRISSVPPWSEHYKCVRVSPWRGQCWMWFSLDIRGSQSSINRQATAVSVSQGEVNELLQGQAITVSWHRHHSFSTLLVLMHTSVLMTFFFRSNQCSSDPFRLYPVKMYRKLGMLCQNDQLLPISLVLSFRKHCMGSIFVMQLKKHYTSYLCI